MARPQAIAVSLNLGVLAIEGEWTVQDDERRAAWDLYVELVTRVSTVPLARDEGSLREALSSLHSLFPTTRSVLRHHGPAIARPIRGRLSLGIIAITILNRVLRPFLSHWHPLLKDHEATRPPGAPRIAHERTWLHADDLRDELEGIRTVLINYARLLEQAIGLDEHTSLLYEHTTNAR